MSGGAPDGHSGASPAPGNCQSEMNRQRGTRASLKRAALWLVAGSISACATPPTLEGIRADPEKYRHENFSLTNANREVVAGVERTDPTALPFSRIVMTTVPHVQSDNPGANANFPLQSVITILPAGGPFATYVEDTSTNGLKGGMTIGISYRGMLALRVLTIRSGAVLVPLTSEVTKFDAFQSIAHPRVGEHLEFKSHSHWADARSSPEWTNKIACEVGATAEARTLNQSIKGTYTILTCELFNDAGQAYEKDEDAYLNDYGIVVVTKRTTQAFITTFDVASFESSSS